MNYIVTAYSIYLPLVVALTVWVARTLYLNSKVFLVDIFHGQSELAIAVNKLLQIGFYLISLGFAVSTLKIYPETKYNDTLSRTIEITVHDTQGMMEELSSKLGGFILILGVMLFFNLFILLILRAGISKGKNHQTVVPQNASIIA